LALPLFFFADAGGDDLFVASGKKLSVSQRSFVENRMKGLRDGNPTKRFDTVQYLIGLNQVASPILLPEVKDNPNPMLVRCAILALSEIGGPDVVSLLVKVAASGSDFGRDERMIAALGLGKLDHAFDISKLRSLVEPRENPFLRKAVALALARKKDKLAARKLIRWATKEREEELIQAFILSAFMIGGEEVIKEVPKLLKNLRNRRPVMSVMALGASFLADPVILPDLLKYSARDEKMRMALSVTLGRYRSPEALAILGKLVSGDDIRVAEDALYSLTFQDEEKALEFFKKALKSSEPSLRKHCILALADSALAAQFKDDFRSALKKDTDPSVRCAGALALKQSKADDTLIVLADALKTEQAPEVISDLLLVLGLMGGDQHRITALDWRDRSKNSRLTRTAEAVAKVMAGKMDVRLLEEMYEERLSAESGRWHHRLRDRVMDEVYKVLKLNRIMHRNTTSGGSTGEETGSGGDDTGDEGSTEGEGGGDEGGDDNQGPGDDGVSGTQNDITTPPKGTSGDDGTGTKKFNFRYEVVEQDIKNWFDRYPYFPDAFFKAGI
jgi:HEAT repeat protein